jgi:hypothetical protein
LYSPQIFNHLAWKFNNNLMQSVNKTLTGCLYARTIGATQEQQDITAEQQEQGQGPTTLTDDPLTDLELKEMNTLTETPHEDLTDEQKKRLAELQQRLPKNPAKLRSKQRQ